MKKYLKYKKKYDHLKKFTLSQTGGGRGYFQNNTALYILADIEGTRSMSGFKDRTDILLGENNKPFNNPHITIHSIHINEDHPDYKIFKSSSFEKTIEEGFKLLLAGKRSNLAPNLIPDSSLKLVSPKGQYEIFGQTPKFFGRKYIPDNPQKITDFRRLLYDHIIKKVKKGKPTYEQETRGSLKYHVYSFGGIPLYAVSQYNHGIGNWTPHISIVSEYDIQNNNKELHKKYEGQKSDMMKKDFLVREVSSHGRITPLSQIDLNEINTIKISMSDSKRGKTEKKLYV